MPHSCMYCTTQITESETACSGCLIAIQDKTPAELKPFLTYVLDHATPELEWIGQGYTLYDRCAGGRIQQYKSLIAGFQTVIDEPYETECGYYDNMVLVHKELNGQYLSSDGKMKIEIHPMRITLFVYPTAMPSWCSDVQTGPPRLAVL